ncbi:MAG: sugar ABC transporter permease [Sphaerochaeta sp.]|uniref:carbohydrate ABC transporter permease n=1 Tax=Sphaerochaeta sp. TaxID=1972642 RepID=UPI001DDA66C6|nr:sugar ABC transporter permease [uncultured Sphaerochaeta sp.]MDD3058943.1 sugar ABC transporter permease [Sphaerochaeta sp.]MDD3930245.1 sugar ABC transporter permease [Sphaerochaeta sp.]NCC13489.1 sugar ABC transporter permease [Spirochaetia bacterium]NCC90334.1 sugar ABC transporter permease [Spirochaetia bacterium]
MASRGTRWYTLLLAPMILVMGAVIGWPLIQTFVLSFTDTQLMDVSAPTFVGLDNFIKGLGNQGYLDALKVSGLFALVVVSSEMILGTSVALLLNEPFRGRNLVRALLILPWAVPTTVNAIMWRLIYNPEYGALNSLLFQLGFLDSYISWLGSADKALWSVMFADVWKNFSLVAMIALASLQTLPDSQIEAAKIDGAGAWQRFRYITLPHLIPSLQVALVLRIIEAVKVFDIIYVMTKGGPANKTRSASIFVYQEAFTNSRMGSGAAYAIIMVCLIMILIAFYIRGLSRKEK